MASTSTICGITVPNTPLVTSSIEYARAHLNGPSFNHIMRSFLFGAAIAANTNTTTTTDPDVDLDREVLAVSAILHDLGWDRTGKLVSKDKCYEVDGANAAREFLQREAKPTWSARRLQLVWDAIALHTTNSIALHKEPEVRVCLLGIMVDFRGPDGTPGNALSWNQYHAVVKEYPRTDFVDSTTEILCGFCKDKPETTYDNFTAAFGLKYVEGFSLEGRT